MNPLRDAAARLLQAGTPADVVEVLQARGSVPREAGTRMLVTADDVIGTVGGGHLELQAIEAARQRLAAGTNGEHEQHFALGPALGQCCGGAVTLRHVPLDAASLAHWPEPTARFTLQLYGAGHVGRAIVALLATLPCRVDWIDEREDQFPAGLVLASHIRPLCVEPVEAEVAQAPPGAYYLVLTHSHALDLEICAAVLRRGDFGFLGLIGSRTKHARFVRRLRDRGVDPALLERLICPIGISGLRGKEPEVVALSAVAQLLLLSSPPTPEIR